MNNRKILTLEEILQLDRRPTLQEMVDLSVEDYTKYLFEKGIIKYIPENILLENVSFNNTDYNDPVIRLRNVDWRNDIYDERGFTDEELKETNKELEIDIIESGEIIVNENKFFYELDSDGWMSIYQIHSDGKKYGRGGTQTWIT